MHENYRLIQAIFFLPGYLQRQQADLYESLEQKAEKICAKGRELRGDSESPIDDDEKIDEAETKLLGTDDNNEKVLPLDIKKVN